VLSLLVGLRVLDMETKTAFDIEECAFHVLLLHPLLFEAEAKTVKVGVIHFPCMTDSTVQLVNALVLTTQIDDQPITQSEALLAAEL
jgi:hypothetical protein